MAAASGAVVIGYGNTLRGDDGVGPRVASLLGRRRPDVRALAVHQLTPELAAVVAECEIAVFVDARVGGSRVEVRPAEPVASVPPLGHVAAPEAVLALAAALYGRCPRAWTVGVPVERLGFGVRLSRGARSAATAALTAVRALLPPAGPAIAARRRRGRRHPEESRDAAARARRQDPAVLPHDHAIRSSRGEVAVGQDIGGVERPVRHGERGDA
jgi:hydrogenase maturation protease